MCIITSQPAAAGGVDGEPEAKGKAKKDGRGKLRPPSALRFVTAVGEAANNGVKKAVCGFCRTPNAYLDRGKLEEKLKAAVSLSAQAGKAAAALRGDGQKALEDLAATSSRGAAADRMPEGGGGGSPDGRPPLLRQ